MTLAQIRTLGNVALAGSVLVGSAYAYRDIKRLGFGRALWEGSTTHPGSLEDRLAKAAAVGLVIFLVTRLVPADPAPN